MKKGILMLALVTMAAASQAQVQITTWWFNADAAGNPNGNDSSATTGTLTPIVGSGTAATFGGTTSTFATGRQNAAAFADTTSVTSPTNNSGFNLTTFPAQGAGSGTRGAQFNVSTAGFYGIKVLWDHRTSNTASRWYRFDYTTDGINWNLGTATELTAGGDSWNDNRMVDLSSNVLVDNTANFAFRIVSVFAPGGNAYAPANATSNYATSGTWRLDSVRVVGQPVPEPATMIGLGAAAAMLAARRRRKA